MEDYLADILSKPPNTKIENKSFSISSLNDFDSSSYLSYGGDSYSEYCYPPPLKKRFKYEDLRSRYKSLNGNHFNNYEEEIDDYTTPDYDNTTVPPEFSVTTLPDDELSSENPDQVLEPEIKEEEDQQMNPISESISFNPHKLEENESDYFFLLSLLPFLNKIPNDRKLQIRHKMQSILLEEVQFHT